MGLESKFTLRFDGLAVKKGLAAVGTQLKSLGSAAMGIAKAGAAVVAFAVGAGAGIAAVALKLNSIGEDAKAADGRLKNITKSMDLFGDKTDDVTDRLLDFADAQERATGTDAIVQTQAKLMTFKELAKSADKMGGAFDRATMAAVDMAAAGFGTAEMNAVQLGKALNDPVKGINSLTRSGITFTAEEKKKIATLVQSNQMRKAQDIILKSIETQIGGTAQATATASGKMKASMTQVVEAFAIPFSEGFNAIPGMLENVFPRFRAKAEQMGKLFGTAMIEAVNGDSQRLLMIGSLMGDLLKEGMKLSLRGAANSFGQFYLDTAEGMKYSPVGAISRHFGGAEKHRLGAEYGNRIAMGEASRSISERYREALAMGPRGVVPNAPEFRYGRGNEPVTLNELGQGMVRIVKVAESIDRRLAPQP